MNKTALELFNADVESTAQQRRTVRKLVQTGKWHEAEPDPNRWKAYLARRRSLVGRNEAESIVGTTEDFQSASFLALGAKRSRAVGYVEVNYGVTAELGTGFLISPSLFITNMHVIKNTDAARGTLITFDRELDERGIPRVPTSFLLDPDRFALFSEEDQLDYAVIALGPRQSGPATPEELGYCILSNSPDKHVLGMNCNIIEHPSGLPKMIAVRNNLLTARTEKTLLYETDTESGSSGAPVFNDDWELIALHHWGQPHNNVDALPANASRNVNEGIRISAIYTDLMQRLNDLAPEPRDLLRQALSYMNNVQAANGRTLQPPRPAPSGQEAMILANNASETNVPSSQQSSSFKFTIPLEVTVTIPGVGAATGATLSAARQTPTLTRGAEAVQIDQDYSNRPGYMHDFIPDEDLPLPRPTGTLVSQLAALRAEEANASSGELKYEHFSIKMNKSKRIAMFTATNIDGDRYLEVDRTSGQVVNHSEGEVWFKDPRISASFFLDQTFYSGWSTYFDRGHLTRRTDPTWGTNDEAERANADTFHFTNCSPQHFRFNQSAKYWQGLERYVLENGLLAGSSKRRICVYQGPIFDDKIDLWADDVQVPSSFFKIVVWRSDSGLKSVGLIADQLKLLSEARHGLGAPQALPSVDVNHWRVPIASIEKKTQLDFGDRTRKADTIAQAGQPQVGEAAILIKGWDAIQL